MRMVSSRSGLVDRSATGHSISSSIWRTYFTAWAGRSAHERAPAVEFLPALEYGIDRLDAPLRVLPRRQPPDRLAVEPVAGAHIDLFQPVEHVELGEGDAIDARRLDRLAHHDGIEPAAAALSAGDSAELAPALADHLADGVRLLGRERPRADAGGIGLGDAEHIAERPRPDAGPGRRLRRHRVGGGDERIGAVVDVEHHPLRAFEQDALTRPPRLVEKLPYGVHVGEDTRGHLAKLLIERPRFHLRRAEAAADGVVMSEQPVDLGAQGSEVLEIIDADGAAADLVLVGRPDAAPRGADLAGAGGGLAHGVEFAVQRQDEGGVLGDAQVVAAEIVSPCPVSFSISSTSAHGSMTTPLPITESLPGLTIPEGKSDSL